MSEKLPTSGQASTYSDYFVGKRTASGDFYSHNNYTAALLPRSRWHAVRLGTKLRLAYHDREVIVVVNDRGAGKVVNGVADESRVLDLSRAAMAYLMGISLTTINDTNAGVINLEKITIETPSAVVGPVK